MTKQEEIRGKVEKYIDVYAEEGARVLSGMILKYLHSQDVVIKVEGKLPGCGCEICDADNGVVRTLVEPLIGE